MSTIIEKARKDEIPEPIRRVAENEKIDAEKLRKLVADGKVCIPLNVHRNYEPIGIGEGLRTKINANIGTSPLVCNGDYEIEKLKAAIKYGADTVMDLSTGGNLSQIRKRMIDESTVPLGTVPIYELVKLVREKGGENSDWTKDDLLEVIERQAIEGVDFMTLHAGVTLSAIETMRRQGRLTVIVSRGGSFLAAWMVRNDAENPLYEYFDEVLDILYDHDVTISLGDGLRPGCLHDATDRAQIHELATLGELTKRAWERNVQVIIEGPGHIPLNEVIANIQLQKKLCHGAPFYVLGPLVTDIAPGYDEITGAIGGAIAAAAGADYLCYVTPAEHLALPDIDDVRRGVIASKIAAHAADIAKGIPGARDWDDEMSRARAELDWVKQIELAIDPDRARERREKIPMNSDDSGPCTMCGEFCSFLTSREAGLYKTPIREKK